MIFKRSLLSKIYVFFLAAIMSAVAVFSASVPARAEGSLQPWRLTSWASPVGSQSLTYESLCGLRALLIFLNANQAFGDREVELFSLDLDDSRPEFISRLTNLIDQKKPDLAVGGAANTFPGLTANFFRRRGILWYGPWSNSPELQNGAENNPLLLFPTEDEEMLALMTYTRQILGASEILFIHLSGLEAQKAVQLAQTTAQKTGLSVKTLALAPEFRDWPTLAGDMKQAAAVFLWVPPGQAAAIVRTFKPHLSPDVLWLTNSLNSPGQELANMTGGLWENMIFPAVLAPKQSISQTYDVVLKKYGLPGLNLDYQTYLGFAQGQLLARALNSPDIANLKTLFPQVSTAGTLLYRQNLTNIPGERNFYLARCDRQGGWQAVTN